MSSNTLKTLRLRSKSKISQLVWLKTRRGLLHWNQVAPSYQGNRILGHDNHDDDMKTSHPLLANINI